MENTRGCLVFGFLLFISCVLCQNPCKTTSFLNEPQRSAAFQPGTTDHLICDTSLPAGWYRFGNDENMPTSCVSQYHCGTNAPIWLKGGLPSVAEGEASRTGCVNLGSCCDIPLPIRVRNCGTYYVYHLTRTPGCSIAYCAGVKPVCGIGSYNVTSKSCQALYPKLTAFPKLLPPEVVNNKVRFPCEITYPVGDPNVEFEVMWNVNGHVILDSATNKPVTTILTGNQRIAHLDSHHLKSHLGQNLHCNVTAHFKQSPNLKSEQLGSNPYWCGIRVSKTSLNATEKQTEQTLTLESTLPVPCTSPFPQDCKIVVEMKASKDPTDVSTNKCRYELVYDPNTKTYRGTVKIKATRDFVDDHNRNHELEFRPIIKLPVDMWFGYKISPVQIHTVDVKSGTCQGTGDPHWTTLNKNKHNTYEIGDFVMYRSKCRDFEVQVRTWACGRYHPCICAIVAKEGNDIIKMDICERRRNVVAAPEIISLGTHPLEETTIERDEKTGKHFYMNFASGTRIRIDPRVAGAKFHEKDGVLNVYITAPSDDNNCVEGLCGTWSGNKSDDFRGPNGNLFTSQTDFSHSWRVPIDQSLFTVQPPYDPTKRRDIHYCKCGANGDVDCTKGKGAHNPAFGNCIGGKCAPVNGKLHPRRSVNMEADSAYEKQLSEELKRRSRATTSGWPTPSGVTEATAKTLCQQAIQQASLFNHCGASHTDVPFDNYVYFCMEDFKYSDGDDFTLSHMNSYDVACLDTIYRNVSNYHTNSHGELTLSLNVNQMACPNNCNRKGRCSHGTCICNSGYIGADCSIIAHKAPSVYYVKGMAVDGTCDARSENCLSASLVADNIYQSDHLQCRYRKLNIINGKLQTPSHFTITNADFKSFLEVGCSIPAHAVALNTSFEVYKVSVTTDGVRWSEEKSFVVYDSKCQICDASGHCVLKNNTCLINGKCYSQGEQNSAKEVCDPVKNSGGWINVPAVKEIDYYTATFSSCQCEYKPTEYNCACCQNGGCQCGQVQPNQCAHCREMESCGSTPELFPPIH